MYKHFFKRFFDFGISLIVLVCLSPFLLVITIWLHFANKGAGAFFLQERPGKNGKIFKVIKYKTMTDERDPDGNLLPDENRLTKVGRFVRSTSIDELPQFYNILKGDMSLVGTRPPTVDEFDKYNIHYRRRLSMTPGLTGLWQVSGRSNVEDFDDVVKYDLEYIDKWSLSLDVKILLQTLVVVFVGKGSK